MARADGGGGGGAFGWTVLGILVGVTATLAVQTLTGGHGTASQPHDDVAAASEPAILPAPPAPPIARPAAIAPPNIAAATAPKVAPVSQTDQEVQDDADAVGMTSRTRTTETSPQGAPASTAN